MAITITTGTHNGANDLVDALAAAWTWDAEDTTSENHSVTWGNCKIAQNGTDIQIKYNDVQPSNFASPTGSGGTYIIAATENAILMYFTNGGQSFAIMAGSGVIAGTETTSKLVGIGGVVADTAFPKAGCYGMVGGTGVTSRIIEQHTRTSANGAQITPYMHAEGGIVCESIALVDIMDSLTHVGKVTVNGDSWYVVGALAIKEE